MKLQLKDKSINYDSHSLIMGILNITQDSFSGDGIIDFNLAISHANFLIKSGIDILDIGGESSKPGSLPISAIEESLRIIPIVKYLQKNTSIILSIDTYKWEVAKKALENGAHIINDINGLRDSRIADLVAQYDAGIVIMHMQGDPNNMQLKPIYSNIVEEISEFFEQRIKIAKIAGIKDEQIILDPGIGFGKTLENNIEILKNLHIFKARFRYPILIGTSRKSFIGQITGKNNPQERVFGTAASISTSIINGANIVRVHDVSEMKDVVNVTDRIKF